MTKDETKQAIEGFAQFFRAITGDQKLEIPKDIKERFDIQDSCDKNTSRKDERMTFDKDKERCELCKYYNRLKHNFKQGIGFEESHACTVWVEQGVKYVQEVNPTSMCEMFKEGDNK